MKFKNNSEAFEAHRDRILLNVSGWSDQALCKSLSTSVFYDTEDLNLKKTAAKYCSVCPVQNQCLYTSILMKEQYGLWGGFTPRQRRLFFKKLRIKAIKDGYDFNTWSDQLASYLYRNTHIQKVAEIIQS